MPSFKTKGILNIIGGILIHITLGSLYNWGNIGIYIVSYYRLHFNPTLSVTEAGLFLFYIPLVMNFGIICGVKLANKIGFKKATLLGISLFSGSEFLSSYAPNFYIFSAAYGIVPAFSVGMAYMLPIYCGWAYFPEKKGLVTGLVVAAFGLSGSVFGIISTWIANPNNLNPTITSREGD